MNANDICVGDQVLVRLIEDDTHTFRAVVEQRYEHILVVGIMGEGPGQDGSAIRILPTEVEEILVSAAVLLASITTSSATTAKLTATFSPAAGAGDHEDYGPAAYEMDGGFDE